MLQGPDGAALAADEAWRAEVPLGNGARDGEHPDLKHKEDAPQQSDIGEGHVGGYPGFCFPHAAVHWSPFCILAAGGVPGQVPMTCSMRSHSAVPAGQKK